MAALKNRRLLRDLLIFGVIVLFLVGIIFSQTLVFAQSQELSDSHFIEIVESPDSLGNPVIQCLDVTSMNEDGLMGQDCFLKIGEVCDAEPSGPTEKGKYLEYWISLDRRGDCDATIRIGAPDLLCRVLIPNGMISNPLVKCAIR